MEDACGVDGRRARRGAAPPPLLRRVDPEPRAARLPAARAGLPRLRRRRRAGRARPRAVERGPRPEEAPATWSWRPSGDGPSTPSTCASAASTARPRAPRSPPWPSRCGARATRRWRPCRGSPASSFPDVDGRLPLRRAARRAGRYADRARARRRRRTGCDAQRRRGSPSWSSRSTSRARPRCTRAWRAVTPYLTGPLGPLRAERRACLSPLAARRRASAGLGAPCRQPLPEHRGARASSWSFACDEALRLVEAYEPPDPPAATVVARAASGTGATEAPRGLLLHQYEIDADGIIRARPDRAADRRRTSSPSRPTCAAWSRPALDLDDDELAVALRAGGAQPRPVHLVRRALPRRHGRALVSARGGRRGAGQRVPPRRRRRARWSPRPRRRVRPTSLDVGPLERPARPARRVGRRRPGRRRRRDALGGGPRARSSWSTWTRVGRASVSGAPASSTHGIGLVGRAAPAPALGRAPASGRRRRRRGRRLRPGEGSRRSMARPSRPPSRRSWR